MAEKDAKPKKQSTIKQIIQIYKYTAKEDKALPWLEAGAFLLPVGTSMNGIYLIGEGEYGRIMKAMDRQEHDIKGVTAGSSIPVYRISVGHGPKQVPLDKLRSTVTKSKSYEPTNHKNALIAKIHPRRRFLLTKAEMETLNDRLRTLQAKKGYAIPKGMDPNHPQKISRRAMRGR